MTTYCNTSVENAVILLSEVLNTAEKGAPETARTRMTLFSTNVLFGNTSSTLNATKRTNQQSFHSIEVDGDDSHAIEGTRGSLGNTEGSTKSGVLSFFFGFMFEDPLLLEHEDIDDEILRVKRGHGDLTPPIWNPLNTALFIAYALTTAATAVPVTLISAMADTLLFTDTQKSAFAPRVTGYAVLGTACGKFMLSSLGDIFGARRTAVCFSILLSLSLLALSMCKSATSASWACFFIEVHSSVMMPCIIILLATHYRKYGSAVYEGGIYVISLASRFGVLLGILLSSLLLRRTSWRVVAVVGAWAALIASSVLYLFVKDSPMQKNSPQNPIDPELLAQFSNIQQPTLCNVISLVLAVFQSNVAPSLKHVLKSPAFYIVALAHTGSSAVRTSERILGTYYLDTSLHTLSESTCPTAVWLSVGLISGLVVAGNIYTKGTERQRKRLITKLYISAILSIYVLAFLAIPWLQNKLNAPSLLLIFQLMVRLSFVP